MTSAQIQSFFRSRAVLADTDYACPTLRWLQGPFWDSFQADRWAKGLRVWERKNDCDNFARAYAQHAQDCHALSRRTQDADSSTEGLAVGEIFYTQEKSGGGHAIVCAFTDAGRLFIEPQNGLTLALTEREIDSIFFVRF